MSSNDDKDLQQLVDELRDLHLKSERIIRQIDEVTRKDKNDSTRTAAASSAGSANGRKVDFKYGDKVLITNTVRHVPITRRVTSADRAGTISRPITSNRIYLETINGHETWRAKKNLKRLTVAEFENLKESV